MPGLQSAAPSIHTIRLGICNTYLVGAGDGFVLVDAGPWRRVGRFGRVLGGLGVRPDRIKLIAVTHAHFDHVGALAAVKRMCGCPVALHQAESGPLALGRMIVPPGVNALGRFLSRIGRTVNPRGLMDFPPVEAEIVLEDDLPLDRFGLAGRLALTRGHTPGSMSLVLDTGQAFIGDVAVNYIPFGLGSVMPPFVENIGRLFETWRELLEAGIKTFYPAHGAPFSADKLEREYERRMAEMGRA